jgi:hypothetical protein
MFVWRPCLASPRGSRLLAPPRSHLPSPPARSHYMDWQSIAVVYSHRKARVAGPITRQVHDGHAGTGINDGSRRPAQTCSWAHAAPCPACSQAAHVQRGRPGQVPKRRPRAHSCCSQVSAAGPPAAYRCLQVGRRQTRRFAPTPISWTFNPHNNDTYLAYNKPGAIMHWLQTVSFPECLQRASILAALVPAPPARSPRRMPHPHACCMPSCCWAGTTKGGLDSGDRSRHDNARQLCRLGAHVWRR